MSERVTGTVKWFNGSKGYGFISREEGTQGVLGRVGAHIATVQLFDHSWPPLSKEE